MQDFTLPEAKLFRELTGVGVDQAMAKLDDGQCAEHRLFIQKCKECQAARRMCPRHEGDFQSCPKCKGLSIPEDITAAAAFIYRKREEPGITFDEFVAKATYFEMLAYVGNGFGGRATPSISPSSPSSSTRSRGSRPKRSGS